MKLSDIAGLLNGSMRPDQFFSACYADFEERRPLLKKRGTAVPVRVVEDADIAISNREVAALCRYFTSGDLNALQLGYIADALQLSERVAFSGDDVADYLAEFTDPEINGVFTYERARAILFRVTSRT